MTYPTSPDLVIPEATLEELASMPAGVYLCRVPTQVIMGGTMNTRSIVINLPLAEPVSFTLSALLAVVYLSVSVLFASAARNIDLPWPDRIFIFLFWPLAVVIVVGWLFWESIWGGK